MTSYGHLPTKAKSAGFISNGGKLQNFYVHNGKGFDISKDINWFLSKIEKFK